jgi:peroxiredoxin
MTNGPNPILTQRSNQVLSEGDKAPAFTLPDQNGERVKLSGPKGQTVVLYFHPRADTAVNSVGLTYRVTTF